MSTVHLTFHRTPHIPPYTTHSTVHLTFHRTPHIPPYTISREGSAVECPPSPNLYLPTVGTLNFGKVCALN